MKWLRKLQNHCTRDNLNFKVISFVNNDNLRIILQKQWLKRRKLTWRYVKQIKWSFRKFGQFIPFKYNFSKTITHVLIKMLINYAMEIPMFSFYHYSSFEWMKIYSRCTKASVILRRIKRDITFNDLNVKFGQKLSRPSWLVSFAQWEIWRIHMKYFYIENE